MSTSYMYDFPFCLPDGTQIMRLASSVPEASLNAEVDQHFHRRRKVDIRQMEVQVDPRRDLPVMTIQPVARMSRPVSSLFLPDSRRPPTNTLQKPRRDICYDWIFSGSSNAHVAIDRSAFMSYQSFESYALTLSDQSRIAVRGIGPVELRVRCKPGSRSHRSIVLENVLHIPDWPCNIFSDIYFQSVAGFDHTWNEFGVNFTVRKGDKTKAWGYTENFCGMDRLVLARRHEGRSPMLDDPLREVFSVNVTWPQSQIDKWEDWLATQRVRNAQEPNAERMTSLAERQVGHLLKSQSRSGLSEISANIALTKRSSMNKISSLRATVSSRSLSKLAKKFL